MYCVTPKRWNSTNFVGAKGIVEYEGIHIVDTLTATAGIRILVDYAKQLIDAGASINEIVEKCETVKRARGESGYIQRQVADKIGKDVRTVLNIENYKGNPKLEVLYPLIRAMNIDAREVFYPELERESPAIRQLRLIVEKCNEAEAAALIPVLESVLSAMRSQDGTNI